MYINCKIRFSYLIVRVCTFFVCSSEIWVMHFFVGGLTMRDDYWDLGIDFRKYMPEEYRGEMYHYTSTGALFEILSDNGISLWTSRQDCLNDTSEGSVAVEIYHEVLEQLRQEGKITYEQYGCFKKASIDSKTPFLHFSNDLNPTQRKEEYRDAEIFVCCFSENNDSLPMWNYYAKGNHYEGYNLGISTEKFQDELNKLKENINSCWSNVEFDIFPIVYSRDEQQRYVYKFMLEFVKYTNDDIIDIDYSPSYISDALREWSAVFKKECFSHEKEIRLIVRRPIKEFSDSVCKELPKISYRHNREYLIPYITLGLTKNILHNICFGPSVLNNEDKNRQVQLLKKCLSEREYTNFDINYSNIPVRY